MATLRSLACGRSIYTCAAVRNVLSYGFQQDVPLTIRPPLSQGLSTRRPTNAHFSSHATEPPKDDPAYRHRHHGIQTHPDSIGHLIQPGNQVVRTTPRGKVQKRYTELIYGYFWNLKDLKRCNEKPVLSNENLIRESDAKVFPQLLGSKNLLGEGIDLPSYCLRKNRSQDPAAQCTLIGISFRDYGFKQLPSWIEPFDAAFAGKDRVEVLKVNISDGWFSRWVLRGFIMGSTKRNTDVKEHGRTVLHFAKTSVLENFRDALRMHNVLTGYVFLLDGLGRVRWAGSGAASEEEAARLIRLTEELTPLSSSSSSSRSGKGRLAPRKKNRASSPKVTRR